MKFALAISTSIEIRKQAFFMSEFSNNLEEYFKDKHYGSDLEEIIIGIICVSPQFEQFFEPISPKYIKNNKIIKSVYTEKSYQIEKCLSYDIKLDFNLFINIDDSSRKKLLALNLLDSLIIIDSMKSKIKDFDSEKFKEDLESYFREKELI